MGKSENKFRKKGIYNTVLYLIMLIGLFGTCANFIGCSSKNKQAVDVNAITDTDLNIVSTFFQKRDGWIYTLDGEKFLNSKMYNSLHFAGNNTIYYSHVSIGESATSKDLKYKVVSKEKNHNSPKFTEYTAQVTHWDGTNATDTFGKPISLIIITDGNGNGNIVFNGNNYDEH